MTLDKFLESGIMDLILGKSVLQDGDIVLPDTLMVGAGWVTIKDA